MASQEVTISNFESIIKQNKMLIIDFWAPWCGPCLRFAPVFEAVAEKNKDVLFVKINTEVELELAEKFEIRSIPTLMVIKEESIIFSQPGALSEDILQQIVDKTREINMDEVLGAD
jgi:thioredoxin 1